MLKLATFNIRYGYPQNPAAGQAFEGERPWYARREGLADQVIWEEPDIIGFQEVLNNQLEDLGALLAPQYKHVGVGRDNGKTAGEAVPLFWRTDRLKLLDYEYFWLSETPGVPGSVSWDAGQTRMVTLAHFSFLLSDEDFYVANTHYDDRGIEARAKSSALILSKLAPLTSSGKLVIVMGDLNSPAEEEGYRVLTGRRYVGAEPAANAEAQTPISISAHTAREGPTTFLDSRHALTRRPSLLNGGKKQGAEITQAEAYGEKHTYTGFSMRERPTLIDYILLADNAAVQAGGGDGQLQGGQGKGNANANANVNAGWEVAKYGVLPNHFGDGVWVSDHRMVVVTLRQA
ncbi:DNase I-like protein [Athelia psychrophila]|uniref:DNase I-like protein n=1 Tax=Athelia psychrophila TaxID=1759441 RepID=A0A166JCC5_9AGAM|nr:DNase I-like protein [Fibularhizoctonia sp. CBS 109695]